MTITHPTEAGKGARAVQTNGIGQRTTAHLNFDVSLADIGAAERAEILRRRLHRMERRTGRRRYSRQLAKIGYAGREAQL